MERQDTGAATTSPCTVIFPCGLGAKVWVEHEEAPHTVIGMMEGTGSQLLMLAKEGEAPIIRGTGMLGHSLHFERMTTENGNEKS